MSLCVLFVLGGVQGLARSVLSALINLSEDERAAKLMCNAGACDVSMRSLLDPDVESRPFDSLHAGMLANLTRFDFGAKAILATGINKKKNREKCITADHVEFAPP